MFGCKGTLLTQIEVLPNRLSPNYFVRRYAVVGRSDLDAIPKRIERKPTDILKALSLTVGRDPNACHYKYPDDPYFWADTSTKKKKMALSMQSGRKSARWVVENYPKYFKERLAEPIIQEFSPDPKMFGKAEATEKTLIECVTAKMVLKSIKIYEHLKSEKIDISNDTKQLLLELVCFYNCKDQLFKNELETNWYKVSESDDSENKWQMNGFAETLFDDMTPDSSLAYSTLIQGMLKHNSLRKALHLFDQAKEKNIKLAVGVYNGLLSKVNRIKESNRSKWIYMEEILKEMKRNKIKPNLYTLNAVLHSFNEMKYWRPRLYLSIETINWFKSIGVQPSLGTYRFLIRMAAGSKFFNFDKIDMPGILNELKGRELEVEHPSDFKFFESAMEICSYYMKDYILADDLHQLLWTNGNVKFLSSNYDEFIFFKRYLNILFESETVEHALKVYHTLVPGVISLDSSLCKVIFNAIQANREYEFLPCVWKSLKQQRMDQYTKVLSNILNLVNFYEGSSRRVNKVFWEVATELLNRMQNGEKLPDSTTSCTLIVFSRARDEARASIIFRYFIKNGSFLNTDEKALTIYFDFCLSTKQLDRTLECVKCAEDANQKNVAAEMAEKALLHFPDLKGQALLWLENIAKDSTTMKKKQK